MAAKKVKRLKYDESDIEVLEGLEPIRRKPGMYITSNDSYGMYVIFKEALDNASDEFTAGRNSDVRIVVDDGKGYNWVIDSGEGIPTGKVDGVSTLTRIVGTLHAGGKLGKTEAYKHSKGTHGVGIKATNAMSEHFVVYTCRKKQWWTTEYKKGKETVKVKKCPPPKGLPHKLKVKQGTIIKWKPDATAFIKGSKLKLDAVKDWCELNAYLNPGFRIQLFTPKGKMIEWYEPKGVESYLDAEVKALKAESFGKFVYQSENIDLAIAFTSHPDEALEGYANAGFTESGGTHIDSLWKSMMAVMKKHALKKQKFTIRDIKDGVVGLINYKIDNPVFSSQTKEKLSDTRVPEIAEPELVKAFTEFFNKKKKLARLLCEKATQLKGAKEELITNKKAISQLV